MEEQSEIVRSKKEFAFASSTILSQVELVEESLSASSLELSSDPFVS